MRTHTHRAEGVHVCYTALLRRAAEKAPLVYCFGYFWTGVSKLGPRVYSLAPTLIKHT